MKGGQTDSSTETNNSPIWQDIIQMVFDAMQSNGVLRNHLSTAQLTAVNGGLNGHLSGGCSNDVALGSGSSCESFHSPSEVLVAGDSLSHLNGSGGIDSWQRKPLLNHDCSTEEPTQWTFSKDPHLHNSHGNFYTKGVVKISLPSPEREEPKFPREKWKTLVALLFFFANMTLSTIALAIVHERLPDRTKYPPLPDIVFDLIEPLDWALSISDILIIVSIFMGLFVLILHKHKFIIFRRVFLMLGLLYLMRSITMFVTQVPVASLTYYCSPKANSTSPLLVLKRAVQLLSGFGLSINGKHTYCGDYIYSGHTALFTLTYLVIREYTPRRCFLVHWFSWLVSVVGVVMMVISRGHYTVDVLIAYYVATRIFWMYHTLANNAGLKTSSPNNFLSRLWWFSIFQYFEGNVSGVVPRQYEWPLPWPRRFTKHDRNS